MCDTLWVVSEIQQTERIIVKNNLYEGLIGKQVLVRTTRAHQSSYVGTLSATRGNLIRLTQVYYQSRESEGTIGDRIINLGTDEFSCVSVIE